MKTAMKELQDALEIYSRHNKGTPEGKAIDIILSGLPKFIEVEKEQMINFHIEVMKEGLIEEGDKKWSDEYLPKISKTAEKYYQQTFKSDE
jgi:hypothetical protein